MITYENFLGILSRTTLVKIKKIILTELLFAALKNLTHANKAAHPKAFPQDHLSRVISYMILYAPCACDFYFSNRHFKERIKLLLLSKQMRIELTGIELGYRMHLTMDLLDMNAEMLQKAFTSSKTLEKFLCEHPETRKVNVVF